MKPVALATNVPVHPMAQREYALLRETGLDFETVAWTQPIDWSRFSACVIRTTWDYPNKREAFVAWLRATERELPLWNPVRPVLWNMHKSYLLDLAAKGVSIPPTRLERGKADLESIMRDEGWQRAVVKPAVGVAAIGAKLVSLGEGQAHLDELLSNGDALVQPYLESIAREGETSLVYFEGEFSHAVVKLPKAGDYRVQEVYGGTTARVEATRAQIQAGQRVIDAVEPLLYARVDLVALDDGTPALMELEAIEPSLFLDRESAKRFARAVEARVSDRPK